MARRRRRAALLAILVLGSGILAVRLISQALPEPASSTEEVAADQQPQSSSSELVPRDPASSVPQDPTTLTPRPPNVPEKGNGKWDYSPPPEEAKTLGGSKGTLMTYKVAAEGDIGTDAQDFGRLVSDTLGDKRGWTAKHEWRFKPVGDGKEADFTVYLASPKTRAGLCGADDTYTSCRNGNSVVINLERWLLGVPHWKEPLTSYREYVINHEVGHRLGHKHVACEKKGTPSPVMSQQTVEFRGCKPNAWPYVDGEYITGPPGEYL